MTQKKYKVSGEWRTGIPQRMRRKSASAHEMQIDAAAKWLSENVLRFSWEGLYPGSARDHGFDPWLHSNARQDDFREAVRTILKIAQSPPAVMSDNGEADGRQIQRP